MNTPSPSAGPARTSVQAGIFPTFFLSGFECSTFIWKDQGRRDLVAETQHREHVEEDYAFLRSLGIAVAREGIPWPFVDRGGAYDFSGLDPFIAAMNRHQILPIWDLCHYGYPDDADPFAPDFAERFAAYARAAAEYVTPRIRGPHFFTPINEITFFAFMGGEWGWTAPFGKTDEQRREAAPVPCAGPISRRSKRSARSIRRRAWSTSIRSSSSSRPKTGRTCRTRRTARPIEDTLLRLGRDRRARHPELGGSPEVLDIVGVNCYSFGQMEYRETRPPRLAGAP